MMGPRMTEPRRFDSNTTKKSMFQQFPIWNGGHVTNEFRQLARAFSDALFQKFYTSARTMFKDRRPLLISGGCGLNCDWNSKWLESGLVEDVFIPPCTDDSGAALGAAVDAYRWHSGRAKLEWHVYCGEPFTLDISPGEEFCCRPLDYDYVSKVLFSGAVLAWVQGRYEIGPRALGNRSILAAPFRKGTKARLNRIKQRENYRPIAPVCIEDRVSKWFD